MRLSRFCLPILALLLAVPATARPLDTAEAKALGRAVKGYLAAVGDADAAKIVAALPPRVMNVFSGATGIEMKKLKSTLTEQTAAMMKGTSIRDVTADESALQAEDSKLADGGEVTWVLIPTSFVSETKGKATRNDQPLLAVEEGDAWYFLRIDGKERRDLAALAYPFLKDQSFPEAKVTPVE